MEQILHNIIVLCMFYQGGIIEHTYIQSQRMSEKKSQVASGDNSQREERAVHSQCTAARAVHQVVVAGGRGVDAEGESSSVRKDCRDSDGGGTRLSLGAVFRLCRRVIDSSDRLRPPEDLHSWAPAALGRRVAGRE